MPLIRGGRPHEVRTSGSAHLQPIVFVLVGVALAGVYFLIANAGSVILGFAPQRASGAAYLVMIPLGYYAHRKITFRSTGTHSVALPRFIVTSCIGLFLAWGVPYVAVRLVAAPHWAAYLLVCIVVPMVSFMLMRSWVFAALRDE